MKIKLKIFSIIIIFIGVLFITNNTVFAVLETWNSGAGITDMDTFAGKGTSSTANTAAQNIMGTIIQTIKVVGYGIAIIMLIYVAIKYMSAAPDEKAEFKKSATAYVVGAVVLFGAASIVGIIQSFSSNVK